MKIPLEPDKYYNIYNHANGKENLFVNKGNYKFFFENYEYYINPIADTFAYCLMPNHFHFALRIKSEKEIVKKLSESLKLSKSSTDERIKKYLSKQFSNLFSSYTQAFNKQQKRKGSLFIPNFSRKQITDKKYLKELIFYIHYNPIHHGFVKGINDWKYSSYKTILSSKLTNVKRNEVIKLFDNSENFIFCHKKETDEEFFSF